jgi:Flp pilus assembly CpaF family ATPase
MSNRDKLINFYEIEEMKKFMPKIDDKQVEYTAMPLNQHFLLCGGTGSGKTLGILNYVKKKKTYIRTKKGNF